MKRYIAVFLCVAMLFALTACGRAEPAEDTATTTTTTTTTAPSGDTTTTTAKPDTDTTDNGSTTTAGTDTTTSATDGGSTTAGSTTQKPTDPSTTTKPTDTTKEPTTTTKKPTTTTKKPTTTTAKPTTTKPVEITPLLPAVGTDIDVVNQKNRIRVSAASYEKNGDGTFTVSLTFTNYTSNWITEETDWVVYTCYGTDGAVVQAATKLHIGCIDTKGNKEKTYTVTVPAGTAEVRLTDSKIVYWTEWA